MSSKTRTGLAVTKPIIAIITEHTVIIQIEFPIASLTFSSSPKPKYWATIIPIPTESPATNEKKKKLSELVVPIAPNAFAPTKLPTIMESTILYNC